MAQSSTSLSVLFFHPAFGWALVATLACAMIALFVSLQLGFFLLFFAAIGWWAWLNPTSAFFFLIVLSPLLPMFKVTQTIGTFTLIKDVLIVVLFGRLFVWPLLSQRLPYRRNIAFAPIMLLVVWVALTAVRADALLVGVLRARELLLYVLLYFVALYVPKGKTFWQELAWWVGLTALSVLVVGAYQWFFAADSAVLRFDPARRIWIPRISSTFAHPSVYGQSLVLLASVTAAAFLTVKKSLYKLVTAVGFLVVAWCIYLTYSRAVWLGLVAALAVIALSWLWQLTQAQRSVRRILQPAAGISIAAVVVLFLLWRFTAVGTFISSGFDASYRSNSARLEFMARLVGPMTNMEALLGRGLGDVTAQNFRQVELTTFDVASGASRTVQLAKDRTLVDNQYLKTFIELGLAGLLIYAWLFMRLLRGAWQVHAARNASAPTPRLMISGLFSLGFFTAFIVQAAFIDIWDVYPTNAFFWIVAGLLSGECVWIATKSAT